MKIALCLISVFIFMPVFAYGQGKPDSIKITQRYHRGEEYDLYSQYGRTVFPKQMGVIMKNDPAALQYLHKASRADRLYIDCSLGLTGAAVLGCMAYYRFRNIPLNGLAGFTVDAALCSMVICVPIRSHNKWHIHDAVLEYNHDCAAVHTGR